MCDNTETKIDTEKLSFEESMTMLEELVRKLESGKLDLDQSLKIYGDAAALREHCKKILEESERKVQSIMETSSGEKREDFKELE